MARRTKRAGISYLETLIAAMLLVITLGAVLSQYVFSYSLTSTTADMGAAYSAGRDAIERVRSQGFYNATEGTTYSYYGYDGAGPYTTQGSNKFKVATKITTDKFVGGTSTPADDATRTVLVTVTNATPNTTLYTHGTLLVRAGL